MEANICLLSSTASGLLCDGSPAKNLRRRWVGQSCTIFTRVFIRSALMHVSWPSCWFSFLRLSQGILNKWVFCLGRSCSPLLGLLLFPSCLGFMLPVLGLMYILLAVWASLFFKFLAFLGLLVILVLCLINFQWKKKTGLITNPYINSINYNVHVM